VVRAHETIAIDATGGEASPFVRAGHVGGEEGTIMEAGDNKLLIKEGVADYFTGRELSGIADGLPRLAEGLKRRVFVESHDEGTG